MDASCPFRRFIRKHVQKDGSFDGKGSILEASVASTSGSNGEPLVSSEEFVRDESALLSLHPWIFKKESYGEGMSAGVDGSRGSLRSKRLRRFSVKPLNFRGNYIGAPFAEEYGVNSPPNSPVPNLRPFVVTDGSRIISRSGFESFGMRHESGLSEEDLLCKGADEVGLGVKRAVIGIPLLPDSRKLRRKSSELQHGRVETSNSQIPCKISQLEGSHHGMLPFCTGISIGMISALLSKRTEVDKLNKLLKQTEDLVQDLQEELEMKDSLSVKELAYGSYESQKLKHRNSQTEESSGLWQNQNITPHTTSRDEYDCQHLNKDGESSISLRKIEAELEAELERLEQNMNACGMEQRMSDLSELDPDLIADVVQGELRADNLASEILGCQVNANSDTNTTSTAPTYNANYAVSPKELGLRLHQLIQTQLEERIEELERELLQSQRQLQAMEAERASSQRTFSNSDMGFSSNQESPQGMKPSSAVVHPFCLNLSGDALDAYDEAYEEFMQVAGKEDTPLSSTKKGVRIDGYKSNSSCRSPPWENMLWSRGSDGTMKYEEEEQDDESDSFTEEEGRMLIQQLVERTKQGFPALTNAQKMVLFMDE